MLIEISYRELAKAEISIQNNYVTQQSLDAYSHIVEHATKHKATFNCKATTSQDRVIKFVRGTSSKLVI